MEQLLDLILGGGLRLPLFNPEIVALERELPRSELLALLMLQRRGEATMSELAADLGAPLSTATGIGARLTRRGLADRHRADQDRRVILVRLTPAGQELAGRIRTQFDTLFGRIQAALSPAELDQLMSLVQKVLHALQAPPAPDAETAAAPPRQIPIEE